MSIAAVVFGLLCLVLEDNVYLLVNAACFIHTAVLLSALKMLCCVFFTGNPLLDYTCNSSN